jgi:hypothetical protein
VTRARAAGAACLLAAALAGPACSTDPIDGYALATSFDESISTVAVPVWGNSTFEHGLETELTDALIKHIHARTPWRVTSPEHADASLTGEITRSRLVQMSTNPDSGLAQEMAIQLTVSFEWKESRTGRVLLSRRGFRSSEPFVPSAGGRESLERGRSGAVDQLAKDIVAALRSSW